MVEIIRDSLKYSNLKNMKKISKKNHKILNKPQGLRLDIGGGNNPQPGFINIDYRSLEKVDIVHDLEKQPWPIHSNSVSLAISSHVIEHINPVKGGFLNFMNEAWRILKPGGQFIIGAPYATSPGMFRDPTHCNFVNEESWLYFSPTEKLYHGSLYSIYAPLPWDIKVNTWHSNGNLEVVLKKLPILPEHKVDKEYLRLLKKHTKLTK